MPSDVQIWTGFQYVPESVYAAMTAPVTLDALKAARKQQFDRTYFDNLAEGYHDETTSITLAASQNDQNQFANLVTMLLLAETQGTELITFADRDGVFQQLPYSEFRTLMIAYGEWCKASWGGCVYAKSLVDGAATAEEVEAVQYE